MTKVPLKDNEKNTNDTNLQKIKKHLEDNNACYVLITCSHPSKEGKMQVEMNYSGDECLAQYLIDGAQSAFDEKNQKIKDSC